MLSSIVSGSSGAVSTDGIGESSSAGGERRGRGGGGVFEAARAGARGAPPVAGDALAAEAGVVGGRGVAEEVVARAERGGAGLGDALARHIDGAPAERLAHARPVPEARHERVGV